MLYKVTPMMAPPAAKVRKPREPGQPARKKRKSAVYDHEGQEVLITLMCLKCRSIKPLMQFGLRKMADGAIRNQPWCRGCRSGAGTPKPKTPKEPEAAVEQAATLDAAGPAELPVAAEPEVVLALPEDQEETTDPGISAQPIEADPAPQA
jgi:hypothetical protein